MELTNNVVVQSSFNVFPGYSGRIPSPGSFHGNASNLYTCLVLCLLHFGCNVVFYDSMVQYCSGDNDTDVVRFLDTLTDRTGAKAYRLASKCDSAGYTLNRMTGQCLKVVLTKKSYVDAKQYCEDEGGVLAKLESTERMIGAINITLIYSDKNGYLVGATDIASEGVWTWQDGTPVEGIDVLFNNYDAKYEPGTPADCGSLYKSVRIGDNRCLEKRQFICERRDLEPL